MTKAKWHLHRAIPAILLFTTIGSLPGRAEIAGQCGDENEALVLTVNDDSSAATDSAEAPDERHAAQSRLPRQGAAIFADREGVRIKIDGVDYGVHRRLMVDLPFGTHRIVATTPEGGMDAEVCDVGAPYGIREVTMVHVSPKRLRVRWHSPAFLLVSQHGETSPAFSLFDIGASIGRHQIGGYWANTPRYSEYQGYADGVERSIDYGGQQVLGAYYGYVPLLNPYVCISGGCAAAYACRDVHIYSYNSMHNDSAYTDHAIFLGPRTEVAVGGEHQKFSWTVSYLIRIDGYQLAFDSRNLFMMGFSMLVTF